MYSVLLPSTKSGVPVQGSNRFKYPNESARLTAFARDNFQCWLCGLPASYITATHNVAAETGTKLITMWRNMGIVPEDFYPGHPGNLISLCANCRLCYDENFYSWIAVPVNIDDHIRFERDDYDARVHAAESGIYQPRSLPKDDEHGVLCQPYFLRDSFELASRLDSSIFPKRYQGYSQAMILKAIRGCLVPCPVSPIHDVHGNVINSGVPQEIIAGLHELVQLWNRPEPKVKGKRKRGRGGDPKGKGKGREGGGSGGGDGSVGSSEPTKLRSGRRLQRVLEQKNKPKKPGASRSGAISTWLHETVDKAANPSLISPPESLEEGNTIPPLDSQRDVGSDEEELFEAPKSQIPWNLGPDSTVSDFMSKVERWRRIDEETKKANQAAFKQRNKRAK